MDNELLQAIGQMMDSKLAAAVEPINARLDKVDSRLDKVDSRLDKVDYRLDKVDSRLDKVDSRLDALSADVARLDHNIMPTLKVIKEGVDGLQERYNRLELVESRQEDHGHRIFAIEQAIKKA